MNSVRTETWAGFDNTEVELEDPTIPHGFREVALGKPALESTSTIPDYLETTLPTV